MDRYPVSHRTAVRLEHELAATPGAREFKRALGLLDVSKGVPVSRVAERMRVTRATVYNWIHDHASAHTLGDRKRSGRPSIWTPEVDGIFKYAMASDPEDFGYMAVDWTLPLLREHLGRVAGITPSPDTIRQHLHDLGYVWKRPRYRLRHDPHRERKKASIVRRIRKMGRRHVVLAEDETDLRLFPPLRGAWIRKGRSREVKLSGRNAKLVVFGSVNIRTGKRLFLVNSGSSGEDFRIYLKYVRRHYRGWRILMLLDEDSAHTAQESVAFARSIGIELKWLPIRCPELNPMESIWRDGKKTICANRQYHSIDDEAERFLRYLELQSEHTALTKAGLLSEDFWLHEFVSKNFSEPT